MKNTLFAILAFFITVNIKAQSVAIDGLFNDWAGISTYADATGDGTGIDLKGFSITNDETNLYVRLIVNTDFNLADSNSLYMNIDADNNSATGFYTNGIGSELGWRFGSKYGFYYHGGLKDTIYTSDLKMVNLPTFKNDTFEIAINRDTRVGTALTSLFTKDTIKLNFVNGITGGDQMPDAGSTRYYVFNNNNRSDFGPVDLAKCNNAYIRLMEYNVLVDGLTDPLRVNSFSRIFKAINPDVIILNECTNTTYTQVRTLLNAWLPLPNAASWNCYKVDPGNIICSRYPVLYASNISFRKATAAYIDLPSNYATNLLLIGTHFNAGNDSDTARQREADVIAAYIRDMKAGTTTYKIPANTPFVIGGDLNMVNYSSPLNTLLTGNIVNKSIYGTGTLPDWNNAALISRVSFIADRNMAYTWRRQDDHAKWWPGKLDYIIHSNTNLTIKKSFVLQTEVMSTARLTQYGLQANDNLIASDHLPSVVDMEIPTSTAIITTAQWNGSVNTAWENTANWDCSTLPGKTSDVTVPSIAPHYPIVNNNTEIRSLHVNNNSNIQIKPGVQFIINSNP